MARSRSFKTMTTILFILAFLAGCSKTLIKDTVRSAPSGSAHCEGSEGVDDSSIAVLPIPIVAFFVPHVDLNEVKGDDFINRCGAHDKLVNRRVEISRAACIPLGLTRIITLGIWQWCPANVSWEADVLP